MSKIVLGVSSSIACYKACDLVRLLMKQNHSVHVVMTQNATELVAPLTLETLSGNPVHVSTFSHAERQLKHLALAAQAQLFAVVPATANVIGKMAAGIADDLLTTTYLSVKCPVLIAPAMNSAMWNHPIVQDNLNKLTRFGAKIVHPASGVLASGEEGMGCLADIQVIADEILALAAAERSC
jgi:phosphopantothenoylcysteine decarboxylase/phosphopantothenate--cysteine ligase